MSVAYIFPGQGAQYVGMGRELAEESSAATAVFEEADDALGFGLSRLCFNGPVEELQLTENTQPALLTASIAAWRALAEHQPLPPQAVAGHSLGEYSALVVAGALDLTTAVRLVRQRGLYMQEAAPVGKGAMAAIIGASLSEVSEVCAEVLNSSDQAGEVCSPANLNSPTQIVIAGSAGAVDRALILLKERGARRAVKLNVSAPFHCALMQPAQDRLAVDLGRTQFHDLSVPLVTNVDAFAVTSGVNARASLIRQVSAAVRWQQTVEVLMRDKGIKTFVEIGPGKVLSGLVRQTASVARCLNVEDYASLHLTVAALQQQTSGAATP